MKLATYVHLVPSSKMRGSFFASLIHLHGRDLSTGRTELYVTVAIRPVIIIVLIIYDNSSN